jgi:hypothetical protein
MSLLLSAVKFNCDPELPGITALNIRKNGREMVRVPEWQAGASVNPRHSRAAYTTKNTWGRPVLIQAQFLRAIPSLTVAEVRAIPAYAQWGIGSSDHLLGATTPRWIRFPPQGETAFETFELRDHHLWAAGVGAHPIQWRWQFREFAGWPWQNFALTEHFIYTLLDRPTLPWVQHPFDAENTQLPWTDVLDYACAWAAGSINRDSAASAITRAVFNLGPALIEYGCPIFALTQYALLYFDCTAFLERLAGGWGNGPYVNCTDCGTIVSTFANALGCDLWQSRMGPVAGFYFDTNPIRAIGDLQWSIPCRVFTGFQYHEVAWKGACSFQDAVFDACLLVNGNVNPALPPMIPELPANLPFVGWFERGYRERLVTASGQLNCVPQPLLRQRRVIV